MEPENRTEVELDLDCVLAFCNDVRRQLRRSPVKALRKGLHTDPLYCVVANTINYGCRKRVGCDAMVTDLDGTATIDTAKCAAELMNRFDHHELPQFEGEGWIT